MPTTWKRRSGGSTGFGCRFPAAGGPALKFSSAISKRSRSRTRLIFPSEIAEARPGCTCLAAASFRLRPPNPTYGEFARKTRSNTMASELPRLIGINHVALEVGDIEEALAFYGRI